MKTAAARHSSPQSTQLKKGKKKTEGQMGGRASEGREDAKIWVRLETPSRVSGVRKDQSEANRRTEEESKRMG